MTPINFPKWIEERRHLFKPPVGNQQVWDDRDFMVTVVGGPNSRTDYHVNQGEEFFYQLEGTMTLRILEAGIPKDIPIAAGEIFLLPKNVPHSPQRPVNTLGVVIERKRQVGEMDALLWVCKNCNALLYREDFFCQDIVKDLVPVIDRFFQSLHTKCSRCGTDNGKN